MKNLFDHAREKQIEKEQPLAARMRPRTLDEYVGQDHILAPGRLLRRAIQADRVSSLIFYGPPGTGKTTLASVIANTTQSKFVVLNAVLSGVKDIRDVTENAKRERGEYDRRTILFVDEVHRWNKAQQDALLPWVENGTVVLIGATTENPYFTVNRALVSRSRIFQLKPLNEDALRRVAEQALADEERGYGAIHTRLEPEALTHLVEVANGDARAVLNALELAIETTPPDEDGEVVIGMAVAEESIQQRAVLYDKEGDYHFDTISAFIKSLRGSDPDATLYWLAKMVYAGEDPRFLFRRMLIFCGEDIGLADPNALTVCTAAAEAFDRVGLPEGRYHLGMAALYLATAPKSNSVMGFFDALAAVEKEREDDVPNHLRDASRDKEGFGHGEGYLYPHAYRDHWVAQQYLPESMQGKVFYQPGDIGYEESISEQTQRRREAQLAAAVERSTGGAPPEILTFSPRDRALEQWLARTVSGVGDRLAEIRDQAFSAIRWERHFTVLDARAGTGLFTWEALRHTPEGGVYALANSGDIARSLRDRAEAMPALNRPLLLVGEPDQLDAVLEKSDEADLRFDVVLGRNALLYATERAAALSQFASRLRPGGVCSLAEALAGATQRLHELVDTTSLLPDLLERLRVAEEAIYANPDDPLVSLDERALESLLEEAGFAEHSVECMDQSSDQIISPNMLDRWFSPAQADGRPSYADHLARHLAPPEIDTIATLFRAQLSGRTVPWRSRVAFIHARTAD
jgi:putative ATPase